MFFLINVNNIVENLISITRLLADDTSLSCTTSTSADIDGILNYASIVWGRLCIERHGIIRTKIQNEAAHIVAGLTRSVSLANIYTEVKSQI